MSSAISKIVVASIKSMCEIINRHIQSSAVITRSSMVRYCMNNCRNWSRMSIRWWTHKRHPIPRPNGRAMGCLFQYLWDTLQWRHNDHDGVSNHKPYGCLLNCLFRRRSKKTSKLRLTGSCAGNSPGPVNSPHKGPVTRKMFPFDDVIMNWPRYNSTALYKWRTKA